MLTPRIVFKSAIAAAAILSAAACDKSSPTDPLASKDGSTPASFIGVTTLPSLTAYSPYTVAPGQVKLCKDISSPAGSYTFDVRSEHAQPEDNVATGATLSPGQCAIIFLRGHS